MYILKSDDNDNGNDEILTEGAKFSYRWGVESQNFLCKYQQFSPGCEEFCSFFCMRISACSASIFQQIFDLNNKTKNKIESTVSKKI